MNKSFPEDPASPTSWADGQLWMPHVLVGLRLWQELQDPPTWDPTALWARAGWSAWAAGRSSVAVNLETEVLEVRGRVLGPEHPATLTSCHNLLSTLEALGETIRPDRIQRLVDDARKLPEGTPIRQAVEAKWAI